VAINANPTLFSYYARLVKECFSTSTLIYLYSTCLHIGMPGAPLQYTIEDGRDQSECLSSQEVIKTAEEKKVEEK
jgi:hypothetical protein